LLINLSGPARGRRKLFPPYGVVIYQ